MKALLPRPAPRLIVLAAIAIVLATPRASRAAELLPRKLQGVTVEEHLGQRADLAAPFTDHQGRPASLRTYLAEGKPVLLTLNYYGCTMLCNLQLNALIKGLRGMDWTPGDQFRIVTVSIDHREGATLARDKRAAYLKALGRGEVDWSFLTGSEASIRRVAGSVGFGFAYDKEQDQYAHPLVLTFLSPEGKISRYLYGLEYTPRDIKFALLEAAQGKVGSTVERLILSCFHYDATSGRYGPFALGIMRLGGAVTVLVLGLLLLGLWWREAARRKSQVPHAEEVT
jgi:protein SCO1/2